MFLPATWWRLTWKWLFKGGDGQDKSKRPLSVGGIRLATFALSLGVCALSLTLAVFSGFQDLLAERMIQQYGHVRYDSSGWRTFEFAEKLKAPEAPKFERAELFWNAQVLILGKGGGRGVVVEVQEDLDKMALPYEGPDELSVTMAPSLAEILNLKLDDDLKLLIPGLVKKALPARLVKLEGVGIHRFDTRKLLVDHTSAWAYMRKHFPETYQRRLGDFHSVRFFLDKKLYPSYDPESLTDWRRSFAEYADKVFEDDLPSVRSWREEKRNFFGGIALDKRLVTVIIAMLSIVAAMGVATSLLVLFFEKDRQIALIRALGLSKRQLRQWTTLQGFMMGLVAAVCGMLLSLGLSYVLPKLPFLRLPKDVYHVAEIPMKFFFQEQAFVVLFGISSATLVAFVLGLALSRMSIVKILGHRR